MLHESVKPDRRLGRIAPKASKKALMFADFIKYLAVPASTNFWARRTPIPLRTFGNDRVGDCTRAKQAVAAMRMERLEQKRTITITDDEVMRVYKEMCIRVYGSDEDLGAYEEDALDSWRRPEFTFKDTTGNPYTIDAYLRIDAKNQEQVKAALALSGAKGIAVCFNLPEAFSGIEPPAVWDVPVANQGLTGDYQPGSWGGHSMWAHDYNAVGIEVDHTWGLKPQRVSWAAVAAYMDEAYLVIDSVDAWRKQAKTALGARLDIKGVVEAVNDISDVHIGESTKSQRTR